MTHRIISHLIPFVLFSVQIAVPLSGSAEGAPTKTRRITAHSPHLEDGVEGSCRETCATEAQRGRLPNQYLRSTRTVSISLNLDTRSSQIDEGVIPSPFSTSPLARIGETPNANYTWSDLSSIAIFTVGVDVLDAKRKPHTIFLYFFHTSNTEGLTEFSVEALVNSQEVDPAGGFRDLPRLVGSTKLHFDGSGTQLRLVNNPTFRAVIRWHGKGAPQRLSFFFPEVTSYAAPSSVAKIEAQSIGNCL